MDWASGADGWSAEAYLHAGDGQQTSASSDQLDNIANALTALQAALGTIGNEFGR